MKAKSLMVQGTASDSGKSTLVIGLCRYFAKKGLRVFPFKSQNMASNSAFTPDGKEISRAQLTQAEAAGQEVDIRMNPIFLKPSSDTGSDVILNGEFYKSMSAMEYDKIKPDLKPFLRETYEEISSENDLILLEGAGSPAEINLQKNDLVNMGMADIADCPVVLVADIDLGGVFASIYGTIELQEKKHRDRIKGIIINKFRGDVEILKPGLEMIEELTGVPVIGVVPYLDFNIEEEDSVSLKKYSSSFDPTKDLDLAIISLDHIGNFAEFMSLRSYEDLSVRLVKDMRDLGSPDIILLPDSTNPQKDLAWLRGNGWDKEIKDLATGGKRLIGLGSSFYLLAEEIEFSNGEKQKGLGILGERAKFLKKNQLEEKRIPFENFDIGGIRNKKAELKIGPEEIGSENGAILISKDKKVLGTDLAGIFDNLEVTRAFLNEIRNEKGLADLEPPKISYAEYKSREYDRLADQLEKHIDMERLEEIIDRKN